MKVLVGSQNPAKLEASREVFSKYFDNVKVVGINVNSKVPNQPIGNETFEGAKNRASELKRINEEKKLSGEFFVGIEGGVMKGFSRWFAFGAVCIMDKRGRVGFGASPYFELPKRIVDQITKCVELGKVMERITGDVNIKYHSGAIGFLTRNKMTLKELYMHGLVVSLIPFLNKEFYFIRKKGAK